MMQEIINITPDMMHKYYNHLDTHTKDKLDVADKYNKNQKNEMKFVMGIIFFIPLFMYIVSTISILKK